MSAPDPIYDIVVVCPPHRQRRLTSDYAGSGGITTGVGDVDVVWVEVHTDGRVYLCTDSEHTEVPCGTTPAQAHTLYHEGTGFSCGLDDEEARQ